MKLSKLEEGKKPKWGGMYATRKDVKRTRKEYPLFKGSDEAVMRQYLIDHRDLRGEKFSEHGYTAENMPITIERRKRKK